MHRNMRPICPRIMNFLLLLLLLPPLLQLLVGGQFERERIGTLMRRPPFFFFFFFFICQHAHRRRRCCWEPGASASLHPPEAGNRKGPSSGTTGTATSQGSGSPASLERPQADPSLP